MLWDAGFLTRRIESAYRNFYQNTSLKSGTSKSRRLQFLGENPREQLCNCTMSILSVFNRRKLRSILSKSESFDQSSRSQNHADDRTW